MHAALVVLDGWGLNDDPDARDAVRAADTPTVDRLSERGATGRLATHGRRVGLPAGQMGNSEVGHLNIGAGRVVRQDSTRISDASEAGRLGSVDAVADLLDHARANDTQIHLMGLVSDGGVHAYQHHLHALIEAAADAGVEAVTHAFTDGRNTAPDSGAGFLADLESTADECDTGDVATVTGRYYAMDRDENWERTARAFDAIANREAPHAADTAVGAVEASYERGDTDEFVEPTLIDGGDALGPDDAAVFVNFRADRACQLTRMLAGIRPTWPVEVTPPAPRLATMTEYDAGFDLPVAFPPTYPEQTLGETLADAGLTQLRMAESEKSPHVTYFLDGGREIALDGRSRHVVPSPDVPTNDRRPEMSAPELTDAAVERIETTDPDVLLLNYANADMVGHTGAFDAAVAAVEAVDANLARLVSAIEDADAHLFVTADHGNADDMGTVESPHTAHTTNPVPFVSVPAAGAADATVRDGGALCDIAPTLLDRIGVSVPDAMTGEVLLE